MVEYRIVSKKVLTFISPKPTSWRVISLYSLKMHKLGGPPCIFRSYRNLPGQMTRAFYENNWQPIVNSTMRME